MRIDDLPYIFMQLQSQCSLSQSKMRRVQPELDPFRVARDSARRLLAGFGLVEVVADVGEEGVGIFGRDHSSLQQIAELIRSVEQAYGLLVSVDVGAVQSGSDEGTLGA